MRFRPGLELCRRYYHEVVGPILAAKLPGLRYAAARIDTGSELLGFDTERSMDHDWGARLQLFVEAEPTEPISHLLDEQLPAEFLSVPTRFARHGARLNDAHLGVASPHGTTHGVLVTQVGPWLRQQLGFDPRDGVSAFDWLATPTQRLAEITGGAVYHDNLGLRAVRERLRWYPDDVWRYVLASQWARIGQEDHLVGRAAEVGDQVGSAVLAARLVRDLMRLILLLHRRYPPYGKWLGSAFRQTPGAAPLAAALHAALTAIDWPDRHQHLCQAYEIVAARANEVVAAHGLAEPVDPRVRPFHTRPWLVLGTHRFADALTARIADSWLRTLPLIGAIDQFVDNTDVLGQADRARAVACAALSAPAHRATSDAHRTRGGPNDAEAN